LKYRAHRNSFANDDVVYVEHIITALVCRVKSGKP
jgi:hypothetical protein